MDRGVAAIAGAGPMTATLITATLMTALLLAMVRGRAGDVRGRMWRRVGMSVNHARASGR
jgi:hypothetical protein